MMLLRRQLNPRPDRLPRAGRAWRGVVLVMLILAALRPAIGQTLPAAPDPTAAGNIFGPAIAYAQKRCVRIYGAGAGMEHGYASGIIVAPDGLILTAQAVLTDAGSIKVVLPGGVVCQGADQVKVLRRSEPLQAVLLKVEAKTPDFFDLPDRPIVQKGDWVLAVGNWFNVAEGSEWLSATVGVVALRAPMETKRRMQDVPLEGEVLLIDAITSNPGAPGGAVLSTDGRLAGMIGKVVESKSTNTRLNYAIPSDLLRGLVSGRDIAPAPALTHNDGAAFIGLKLFTLAGKGAPAYVDAVVPGSPAALAGLQKDDLVLRVGEVYVESCKAYLEEAAKFAPGVPVALLIKRQDQVLALRLTPAEPRTRPGQTPERATTQGGRDGR